MPLIRVNMIGQTFASDQKKEIISKLSHATVAMKPEKLLPVTWISIEEICSGEWDIGGTAMTSDAVHDLAAAKK
jgi:phenylpyruvate tautomerase PptA (4-oxalocrotonate tautomerase family)